MKKVTIPPIAGFFTEPRKRLPKGREPSFEAIDGVMCALVPLGKEGKQGRAIIETNDWDRYLANDYSPRLRLNSSRNVVTGHRQSARSRSCDTTVARIILRSQAKKGHRASYVNGDRKDLRRKNLVLVRGKGGDALRPNMPDPRTGRREVHPAFIATKQQADQRKDLFHAGGVAVSKMGLPPNGLEWTAENIAEKYDWK